MTAGTINANTLADILRITADDAALFLNSLPKEAHAIIERAAQELRDNADEMRADLDAIQARADKDSLRDNPTLALFLDLLEKQYYYNPDDWRLRNDLDFAGAESLPADFVAQINAFIKKYSEKHPATVELRDLYEQGEQYKKNLDAAAKLTALKLTAPGGAEYLTFVERITADELRKAADICKRQGLTEWEKDFSHLADEWDKDHTPDARRGLFESISHQAGTYLYRQITEGGQINPLPSTPSAPLKLSYIKDGNVTAGIDKISTNIFGLLENVPSDGQLRFAQTPNGKELRLPINAKTDKDKDGNQLFTFCTFVDDIPGVTLSRNLESRDEWYLTFCGAMYEDGCTVFSHSQLYKRIYGKRPSESQIKNFRAAIDLMMRTQVEIRNDIITTNDDGAQLIGDAATDRPKYPKNRREKFSYRGALLPCEIVTAVDSHTGKVIKDAIHIFRYPPTLQYARSRSEIITINADLIRVPGLSLTNTTATLYKYILTIIGRLKRQKNLPQKSRTTSPFITKEKLFEICHVPSGRSGETNRRRMTTGKDNRKGYIPTILDYYQERGEIKSWKEYPDKYFLEV